MSFKTLSKAVVGLTGRVMGDDITYTPVVGTPVTIKGVFDNAWLEVEDVSTLKPVLRIDLDDLDAAPTKGDLVTVDTVEYSIQESHPDGYGGTTLILKKV